MRERTLGPSSAATSFWIESKTEGASDPVSWSSRSTLRSALFAPGRGGAWWHAADDTFAIGQASRGGQNGPGPQNQLPILFVSVSSKYLLKAVRHQKDKIQDRRETAQQSYPGTGAADSIMEALRPKAPCHRPCAFVSRGDQNLRRGKHHTYSDERQQTHTHGPHTRKYEPKQGG